MDRLKLFERRFERNAIPGRCRLLKSSDQFRSKALEDWNETCVQSLSEVADEVMQPDRMDMHESFC